MGCCFGKSADAGAKKSLLDEQVTNYSMYEGKTKLFFYAHRGEAEAVRLALQQAGVTYEDTGVMDGGIDIEDLKARAGSEQYTLGIVPVLRCGTVHVSGVGPILRHIGRRHDMYGKNPQEMNQVDMLLEAVSRIRAAYDELVDGSELAAEAKVAYEAAHLLPGSEFESGGAHFALLQRMLERNAITGSPFAVGSTFSIADAALFDIVDIHLRHALFPSLLRERYPALVAHYYSITTMPEIARYLGSTSRLQKVNGSGKG